MLLMDSDVVPGASARAWFSPVMVPTPGRPETPLCDTVQRVSKSFELDPAEELAVAARGEPGEREFFLVAGSHGEKATLLCEKFHVQGLVVRAQHLLEAQGLSGGFDPTAVAPPPTVADVDWRIGELGLGYHESRKLFVVVAREAGETEDQPTDELATARFWVGAPTVRVFAKQAEAVLSAGRAICTYCGLPIDPSGHPCPASNGPRPIF